MLGQTSKDPPLLLGDLNLTGGIPTNPQDGKIRWGGGGVTQIKGKERKSDSEREKERAGQARGTFKVNVPQGPLNPGPALTLNPPSYVETATLLYDVPPQPAPMTLLNHGG